MVAGSPLPLIAGLFVAATLRIGAEPNGVARLVAAMRAACNEYELDDPFDTAVQALLDVVRPDQDPQAVSQFMTTTFAAMDQQDRSRAAAIVLK